MGGFYELTCVDFQGFFTYYYFYSPRTIRNLKVALNNGYAPDRVRLIIDDGEESPVTIRFMHNIFEYIYLKYFKKRRTFIFGYRVDWEKELKKYLNNT